MKRMLAASVAVTVSVAMMVSSSAWADPTVPTSVPSDVTIPADVPSTVPVSVPESVPSVPASVPTVVPATVVAGSTLVLSNSGASDAQVATAQLIASPTTPVAVSSTKLSTAGGKVTASLSAVPDSVEAAKGLPAGTKMLVSSDTSKLTNAAKTNFVATSPALAKKLFPVDAQGNIASGLSKRITFQAGEKLQIAGTVAQNVRSKSKVVVEKASILPDGTVGSWVRAHSLVPDSNGKFAQNIVVKKGLQQVRTQLLVGDKSKDALGVSRVKWRSYLIANASLTGTNMVTLKINNDQSDDLRFTMSGWPEDGCDPNNQTCTYSTYDVVVNKNQTETITFIEPNDATTIGFTVQKSDGCVGKCSTYIPDWSAGVNGKSCTKLNPTPGQEIEAGQTWTITVQGQFTGYNGFLDSPSVANMPSSKNSKKYPNGCVFAMNTAFQNWLAGQPGWAKWIEAAVGTAILVGISFATFGLADDGLAVFAAMEGVSVEGGEVVVEDSVIEEFGFEEGLDYNTVEDDDEVRSVLTEDGKAKLLQGNGIFNGAIYTPTGFLLSGGAVE